MKGLASHYRLECFLRILFQRHHIFQYLLTRLIPRPILIRTAWEISIINLHILLVNIVGSERVWCLHPNEIRCGEQGKDQRQTCDGITRDAETSPKVVSEETVDETSARTEENGYE